MKNKSKTVKKRRESSRKKKKIRSGKGRHSKRNLEMIGRNKDRKDGSDSLTNAVYKCMTCSNSYISSPGPTQCPSCQGLYVEWVNYEESFSEILYPTPF